MVPSSRSARVGSWAATEARAGPGTERARVMIAHAVGVTPVAAYELKWADLDFFADALS